MSSCPKCNDTLPPGVDLCTACGADDASGDPEPFREAPTVANPGAFLGVKTDLDPRDDQTPLEPRDDQTLPTVRADQTVPEPRDDQAPADPRDDQTPLVLSLMDSGPPQSDPEAPPAPSREAGEDAEGNITERNLPPESPRQSFKDASTRAWDARFDPQATAMAGSGGEEAEPALGPPLAATALHTPRFSPPPIRTEQIREEPTNPAGSSTEGEPTNPAGSSTEGEPTNPAGSSPGETPADLDHEEEGDRLEDLVAAHRPATRSGAELWDRDDGTTFPRICLGSREALTPLQSPTPSSDVRRLVNILVGFLASVLLFGLIAWLIFR